MTRGHASSSSAGNSGYDEQEEKKEERVRERVSEIRQQLRTLTQPQIDAARRKVRETVAALEAARDLSRVWLHVDMDMFYGTPLTHSLTHSLARSLTRSLSRSLAISFAEQRPARSRRTSSCATSPSPWAGSG